jgi:ubiquitin-like 1-activating enzyme E1 B
LERLSKRLKTLQQDNTRGDAAPILTFDKDDIDTMDFVAASANLRSTIFGIESRSKFDLKRMTSRPPVQTFS